LSDGLRSVVSFDRVKKEANYETPSILAGIQTGSIAKARHLFRLEQLPDV
jgi:hypothetical protein